MTHKPRPSQPDDKATRLKARIINGMKGDLAAIEDELTVNLHPQLNLVKKVAGHILFSGGKRLRPILMILCARLCGYTGQRDVTYATSFEYLHAATLLHDDLIDGGTLRRGKPAAHTIFGNETAVLTGDFLLARALAVAAMTENIDVVRTIVDITEQMSQGEIDQLDKKGVLTISETEYMEIIRRKTAVLFQGACRVGALVAGAEPGIVKSLSKYGRHLGIAFQMTDDLLDYTSDIKALGKKTGADLKEGKLTLPVIYALNRADDPDRRKMESIILDTHFSEKDFAVLIQLLQQYGGIDYTQHQAALHVDRAREALSGFSPGNTLKILIDVADYALVRKQ